MKLKPGLKAVFVTGYAGHAALDPVNDLARKVREVPGKKV